MPQSKAQLASMYPFTKKCKDVGIARLTPPDSWFIDRGVPIPTSKPAKVEVFAAHTWALGCCDFADEAKTTSGWDLALSRAERAYLYSVCRHPVAAGSKETKPARAMRLLQAFPPRPASPPRAAAGSSSVASAPASPTAGGHTTPTPPASPRSKVQKLLSTLSPATAAFILAGGASSASATTASGGALGLGSSAPPTGATTASWGALGPGSSALPTGAPTPTPGLAFGSVVGASPAARRGLFSSPFAQPAGLGMGTVAPPTMLTYGQVRSRLGAAEARFNLTGDDDWSADDRKRFRNSSTDVVVNSEAAAAQGWSAKPPYSLLLDILGPAAPSSTPIDESARLGGLLARAARWRDVHVDPDDMSSDAAARWNKIIAKWRDYCEVSLCTPLAASTRLAGLKRIVLAYFRERLEDLLPDLRDAGLGELAPFIEAQSSSLPRLFTEMENRVAALADRCHGEAARAAATNTEWMLFYHPFFQGIFRVDGTELAPSRCAAALAFASAALSAGGAPAAPPQYLPPPPLPHRAPQAALVLPPPGASYFAPAALPPPPPGPPPPRPAAGGPSSLGGAFGAVAAAAGLAGAARGAPRHLPIFLPCSAEVIGPQLAVWLMPPQRQLCRACPGCAHAHFECPVRYAARLGHPCPGFDASGARVPGDWSGHDLQRATRSAWTAYASRHGLTLAPGAPGPPQF